MTLSVQQLASLGAIIAGAADAAVTFTDSSVDGTPATTFTFTDQNIGTASTDRYIIVGIAAESTATGKSISSVTVAGNAATQVVQQEGSLNVRAPLAGIYIYGPLVSGTTATIAVTFSASMNACGIGVWAATGLQSATATATASDTTGNPRSATINVSAGGILVGVDSVCVAAGSGGVVAWTNLTEKYDEYVDTDEGFLHSGASDAFATAQTGLAVSAESSGSTLRSAVMTLAAFR